MKLYEKSNFFKFILCFVIIVSNSFITKIHAQNNLTSSVKITNYSDLNNWAAHPLKKYLSDSISE